MASRELNILIKAKNLASGAINGVKGELKGLDRDLGRIGSKAGRNIGRNVERGIMAAGAGIAAGATFAVTTAASFEQAETGIRKTVSGSIDEVDALIAKVKEMSTQVPVSFEELAAIAESGGALGVSTQALDEFTDVVARLSVSTDLTADSAATSLGQLMNILGMSETDLVSFGNSLVNLGNNGASTEDQIVEMAARFGAAGKSAGLSNEEILALSSTVASMGIEVEAGGSSLSRLFNNIATNAGTSSTKAKNLAEALGFIFEDGSADLEGFKDAWAKDGLGTFQQLLEHINTLDQFEAGAFLKSIGVTNTRDVNALRNLARGAEFLGEQVEIATDHQDAMTVESEKFFDTTQGKWKVLQNNIKLAAATIGAELLPVVNDLMTDFVKWLQLDTTQAGIKEFAKDFAGHARDVANWLKDLDWGAIASSLQTAAGAAKAILDAFLALPDWVKQVLIGGWAANKFTGGAVGDLLGLGGKALIGGGLKGIFGNRGATPANPVFTKEVGLGGAGGGVVGGGGGGKGLVGNVLKFVPVIGAAAIASEVGDDIADMGVNLHEEWGIADPPDWLTDFLNIKIPDPLGVFGDGRPVKTDDQLTREAVARSEAAVRDAIPWQQRIRDEIHNANMSEGARFADLGAKTTEQKIAIGNLNASEANRHAVAEASRRHQTAQQMAKHQEAIAATRALNGPLNTIANKNFSPRIQVTTHVNSFVSIHEWQRTVQSAQRSYYDNTAGI